MQLTGIEGRKEGKERRKGWERSGRKLLSTAIIMLTNTFEFHDILLFTKLFHFYVHIICQCPEPVCMACDTYAYMHVHLLNIHVYCLFQIFNFKLFMLNIHFHDKLSYRHFAIFTPASLAPWTKSGKEEKLNKDLLGQWLKILHHMVRATVL